MNTLYKILIISIVLSSCKKKADEIKQRDNSPTVSNNGQTITFPDEGSISFFNTEKVGTGDLIAEISAPAKISATIISSGTESGQNLVLFEDPELAGSYTQLIQHQININQIKNINILQRQVELSRVKDLVQHGAATGQELMNAQAALSVEQTNLANEKAALTEHEAKLIASGFSPEILKKSSPGTAYLICDIPENQVEKIKEGQSCNINFTAFPNQVFKGKLDAIADMVDNVTRMIKVRISMNNSDNRLKSGMFANVSFSLNEGNLLSISNSSFATVQGRQYVFVKTSKLVFERKEIHTGQQFGDRIAVFSGISIGDNIAVDGVMQLKGLSFGY